MKRIITVFMVMLVLSGCSLIADSTKEQRKLVGFGLYFEEHLAEPVYNVTFDTPNFTYFMIDWDYFNREFTQNSDYARTGIIAQPTSGFRNMRTMQYFTNDQIEKYAFFVDIDINNMVEKYLHYRYYLIVEDDKGNLMLENVEGTYGQVNHFDHDNAGQISFSADGITYELNVTARFSMDLVSLESIEFNEDGSILKRVNLMELTEYIVEGDFIMIHETRMDRDGNIMRKRTLLEHFYSLVGDTVFHETYSYGIPQGDDAIAQQHIITLDHVNREPEALD